MGFDAPLEEINALFETFVNAEGGSNKHTLQLSQLSSLIESYGKANAMALDNDVSLDDTAEPATSRARPGRCTPFEEPRDHEGAIRGERREARARPKLGRLHSKDAPPTPGSHCSERCIPSNGHTMKRFT